MDTDLTTYAATLLSGTGTDPADLHALASAGCQPHETDNAAAAAVLDGWCSAEHEGGQQG